MGAKKYPKFEDKQYISSVDRREKGVKNQIFCGRHIWKQPKAAGRLHDDDDVDPGERGKRERRSTVNIG